MTLIKLNTYSNDLPTDAGYGNLTSKMMQSFKLLSLPNIKDTTTSLKLGVFNTSLPDPDWLVQLRKDVDTSSEGLHGMVVDAGASTCATPHKSDFLGLVEHGNFGQS